MSVRRFHPGFRGRFGVGQREITPPVGIYNRAWGAALSDQAQGVHRPLTLTALVIYPHAEAAAPLVIVSLDLGAYAFAVLPNPLEAVFRAHGLDPRRCIIAPSHTHAGAAMGLSRLDKPGGHLIPPFRELIALQASSAIGEALATAEPGYYETGTGHCTLASNRDFPDPETGRLLTGWNPEAGADTTLLIGRVCRADGTALATLVNYACHPTILAWENQLISPDYVGAMREVVERETNAPCLFLQGASGELAARHQYTGEHAVADRAGRCLGHAVVSTLHGMFPPGHGLGFEGAKASGAPLALWRPVARTQWDDTFSITDQEVCLPLKPELASLAELEAAIAASTDRVITEQLERRLAIRRGLGDGAEFGAVHHFWQLGEVRFVSVPNEIYSGFQQELRVAAGEECGLFVVTLSGGSHGYLPPREIYAVDGYTAWQTPYAPGGYELMLSTFREAIVGAAPLPEA